MIRSKILVLLTAVITLTVLAGMFTACDDGGSSSSGDPVVTFDKNGGDTEANPKTIKVTSPATTVGTLPTAPTKANNTFAGWFTVKDATGGTEFTATTPVTKSIKVYARWTVIVPGGPYTVTFNKNGGDTEANPATKTVTPPATTVDALPTAPTKANNNFAGWFTVSATTGGTEFTATTNVTASIEVFARWTASAPTDLVIENPTIEVKEEAPFTAVATIDANGIITLGATGSGQAATGGALMYKFPAGTEDYDYVKVEYTIVDKGTGTQNDNGNCEIQFYKYNLAGNTAFYGAGVSQYVALTAPQYATKNDDNTYSGELNFKVAGGDSTVPENFGFSWRYNGWEWDVAGVGRSETFKIKITKITFSKAVKHTVNFNLNYTGTDTIATPASIELWEGEVIANIPGVDLPVPTSTDKAFYGWWTDNTYTTMIGGTYLVTSSVPATLVGRWETKVAATTISVDFNDVTFTVIGAGNTAVASSDGTNYLFTSTLGGYQSSWVKFVLDLPLGVTLGDYSTVTFWLTGTGDAGWKNISVLAGTPLPDSLSSDPKGGPYHMSTGDSSNNYTNAVRREMTIALNKTKAASLLGGLNEIEVSIYPHAGASTWLIEDLKFNP